MQNFEFANPATLNEALGLLGSQWGEADVLAGGTDLLSLMKEYLHSPKRVVNIKNIKELGGIAKSGTGLRIGATVTLDELASNALVRQMYPSLAQAALEVSSPQLRNMGTVGGDLCQRPRCWYFRRGNGLLGQDENGKSLVTTGENKYHAIFGSGPALFVSASSFGPALVALGAKVTLVSASGKRDVPMSEFFVSPKSNGEREIALKPNEILTQIMIPAAGTNATYEVRHREAVDWPLTSASVNLTMAGGVVKSAVVVMGHVAATPWRASQAEQMLTGKKIDAALAERAGEAAVANATPLSENGYKVQLAKVAVKRAILKAAGLTV